MKKTLLLYGELAGIILFGAGCGVLEFKTEKIPGETYYVSVQQLPIHEAGAADSPKVGNMQLGDSMQVMEVVPLPGHLLTDHADSWVKANADGKTFYVPGGAIISQALWQEQLKGLPPRGQVKVKNFTSASDQETDADMMQSRHEYQYRPGELRLMLGAAGTTTASSAKAYPAELGNYIIAEKGPTADIKLPEVTEDSMFGKLPSLQTFLEIGPYQEFDLGAGLAAFMMPQAISPQSEITQYVTKVVDRLLAKSHAPYAFSGYHVIVLKDDDTINACAAPGGFIMITTGMLNFLENENELAMILAHEIGHLEFHHSVRQMGPANYATFALSSLDAATDLNDPAVKQAIVDRAIATTKAIPFFDKLPVETQKQRIDSAVSTALDVAQKAKNAALQKMSELAMMIGNSLTEGYDVEFEAAADRRAVSLGAAAGYDVNALNDVLARIKKANGGFGKAYPADRDKLVAAHTAAVTPEEEIRLVGDYKKCQNDVSKLTAEDLFIKQ